jgi:hypothetical protein
LKRGLIKAGIAPSIALTVVCLSAMALSVAQAGAANCPSLRRVKTFHGQASASFAVGASGEDPSSGGTETIGLGRAAQKVTINLFHKIRGKLPSGRPFFIYNGHASGGTVGVADSFENTGTDVAGDATYSGPLRKDDAGALVLFDRKACKYKFDMFFEVDPVFEGDEELKPGTVGGWTHSEAVAIPDNLSLHGSEALKIHPDCVSDPLAAKPACAGVYNFWTIDVIELTECGSLDLTNCTLTEDPEIGTASLSWHLKPTFYKKKKKK